MPTANSRHILVATEELSNDIKDQIAAGASFDEMAKEHSSCPSGRSCGDLGSFGKGQMVPEFDKVVFEEEINVVHGPVKTQFGYHLLETTKRQD